MAGLFHGQYQCLGMLEETLTGWCEGGSGSVTYEQLGVQIGFQILDAGADCGLGDMQSIGGFKEAAVGGYGQESSGLFYVHDGADYAFISKIAIV